MHQGAVRGVGDEPVAGLGFLQAYGLGRAFVVADSAPLAGQRIYQVFIICLPHRLEATNLGAPPTGGAESGLYDGYLASSKLVFLLHLGRNHQFQVGRVHIGIDHHFPLR
jgi:hypothetical protein